MEASRILFVNGNIMGRGGVESFMMNYYRYIDRSKIQIDFVVHGFEKGDYDDEILELGGRIYQVPVKSINYRGNIKALKKIITDQKYNIIHAHMDAMSYIPLKIAKKEGVSFRIAHSHSTGHLTNNPLKKIINEYARYSLRRCATHFFACSSFAGKWLFGEKLFEKKGIIINNAIEAEKFLFNSEIRSKIRVNLGIEKKKVLGHVGRFIYQKNHIFLLKILSEVIKIDNSIVLVLVGNGYLKKEIENEVVRLSLMNNIVFLDSRNDVNDLLNAFDILLLPSYFEGLSICLIESQANGLPAIISDTITQDVDISGLISFKPLNNIEKWTDAILNEKNERNYSEMKQKIMYANYDIVTNAKRLQDFYQNLI